ncbi:MAG TPA: beta-ketoacyl synthase N-terminal-like domain-containing protein [Stellaceae bacterium]|jgi:acyl transferase domain-containing protein
MTGQFEAADEKQEERLRRALVALDRMQALVEAGRRAQAEPIAIVGIGCRFPGGVDDAESYWRMLRAGADAISEVPRDRWDIDAYYAAEPGTPGHMCSRFGGFVDHVGEFDPLFFGIAPREAEDMDPQQYLVLETAWHALEDAGIDIARLYRSSTGVFLGAGTVDHAIRRLSDPQARAAASQHLGTGTGLSVIAGRVSYVLGLNGPCLSVDTACSSSLVSVHLACTSLRLKECDQALAGGVSVLLDPAPSVMFSQARMLAPDGRCRTFDAAASGYVRGEGCGVLVLKRLSDAKRDGNRIIALILGSAVNHDGPSGGLTVPNGPAQQAVIAEALRRSDLRPDAVGYVECHGTGTPLGDPIEVEALGGVFAAGRRDELLIGSVKTNLGHLEVAAGIAGLIKATLAVAHREVPPHLHFQTPNPRIGWEQLPFRVPITASAWPVAGRAVAGVSGFGFSGTNAHIVVAAHPSDAKTPAAIGRQPRPLFLSAKTPAALRSLAAELADHLAAHPELLLDDVAWTLAAGRMRLAHWLVVAAVTLPAAVDRLKGWARGEIVAGAFAGHGTETTARGTAAEPAIEATLRQAEMQLCNNAGVQVARGWRIALPTYPFERRPFPLGRAPLPPDQADAAPFAAGDANHPLLGRRLALAGTRDVRFESRLSLARLPFLGDHRVFGAVLLPAACFIEMAVAAGRIALAADGIALEDVVLRRPLVLPDNAAVVVQTVLAPDGEDFTCECFSAGSADPADWENHFSARLRRADAIPALADMPALRPADPDALYAAYAKAGIAYGPRFRVISALRQGVFAASAELSVSPPCDMRFTLDPLFLDAAFQLLGAAFAYISDSALHLPVGVRRVVLRATRAGWLRGRCRARLDGAARRADVALVDEMGEVVALLSDITLLPADVATIRQAALAGERTTMRETAGVADLRSLVSAVLHVDPERIDVAAPLTALGLDSLMALDLRQRARAQWGWDIPLEALIGGESIDQLLQRRGAENVSPSAIVEGEL